MKKSIKLTAILVVGLAFLLVLSSAGCISSGQQSVDDRPSAVCTNGVFVGTYEEETGVVTFKGIPFAKQPVGDLRWKAPQPAEASDDVFDAVVSGPSALQTRDDTEPASLREQSEACLTLDLWTKNLTGEKKPVMVFIHGGSYGWGGSAHPNCNGQYLTDAHENLILVSVNYRLDALGYIDFSSVEGGEDFPDSGYLGVLDVIEALNWMKANIEAFGGDPENITIFGESAGGGTVGCLLVAKPADGLFQRAILQSGDVSITYLQKMFQDNMQTDYLLKITGSKNMDDLMALSTEEIKKALETDTGKEGPEGGSALADLNNRPLRGSGSIIPEKPYEAMAEGAGKDVDIMIGTTADEMRYWVLCMEPNIDWQTHLDEKIELYYSWIKKRTDVFLETYPDKDALLREFFSLQNYDNEAYADRYPGIWNYSEFITERSLRIPALKTAEAHLSAGGTGKTYMYLFEKSVTLDKLRILGACHAIDLSYVFNNVKDNPEFGPVNKELASAVSSAWVNFATTGDPGYGWTEYNYDTRSTMIFGNDNTLKMVDDPKREQRELLMPYSEAGYI